jgi:hypothetical protein
MVAEEARLADVLEFDPRKEYRKGKKTYLMGETTVRAQQAGGGEGLRLRRPAVGG